MAHLVAEVDIARIETGLVDMKPFKFGCGSVILGLLIQLVFFP